MRITVDAADVKNQIVRFQGDMAKALDSSMDKACIEVERVAKQKCPTGEAGGNDTVPLRQSIMHEVRLEGGRVVGIVGSGLDYAVYVHEGTGIRSRTGMGRTYDLPWSYQDDRGQWHTTSGQEAQPFLEEAYNESRDRVMQILAGAVSASMAASAPARKPTKSKG